MINSLSDCPAHSSAFKRRRALNWLPLGLTYAFLYMARYNLTVSKNALGSLMTKEDFGIIFAVGTWVYAVSFLINGPLTDKIGGKKAILIGAAGSALMNIAMGVVVYGILALGWTIDLTVSFCITYGLNMYFQSYGAVSIVKVNSAWFHVRERGTFGGIFGILISLGLYFAFDWSQYIVNFTESMNPESPHYWLVFFIPAGILLFWFLLDIFILRDYPHQAGFQDFDTGDASSGETEDLIGIKEVLVRIFTNPIIITIGLIEFCTGVLRNGVMHWFPIFAKEQINAIPMYAADWNFWLNNWGLILAVAGAGGGMLAGWMSDHLFGSRRAPVAGILYFGLLLAAIGMTFTLWGKSMDIRYHGCNRLNFCYRNAWNAQRYGNNGFRRKTCGCNCGRIDRWTCLSRHRRAIAVARLYYHTRLAILAYLSDSVCRNRHIVDIKNLECNS